MEQYFCNHEVAYLSDRKVHKKTQTIRVHKAGVNEMSDMSNLKKLGGSAQKHIWMNSVYTSKAEPKS